MTIKLHENLKIKIYLNSKINIRKIEKFCGSIELRIFVLNNSAFLFDKSKGWNLVARLLDDLFMFLFLLFCYVLLW